MLFVMLKNDFIIYNNPMNDLHAYLPLSSCPGMTISSFAMTLRGRGPVTRDNLHMGQVVLVIAAAPRGMPKISVTVEVQWDGSVSAIVEEDASYRKAELEVSIVS